MMTNTPQRSGKSATTVTDSRHDYTETRPDKVEQWMQWADDNGVLAPALILYKWVSTNAPHKSYKNRSLGVKLKDDCIHVKNLITGECINFFDGKSDSSGLSQEQQAERKRLAAHTRKLHEVGRQKGAREAAKLASQMWANGYSSGEHRYVDKKQLVGIHNARIDSITGELLVPMWVHGIGLVNVQRIYQNGEKRFLKGGRVKGAYSVIGSLDNNTRVLICEGWATGATLHELYGLPVVVAFNAGNLMAVARVLRSQFPTFEITFCSDDDRQTRKNPGLTKAVEAADAIGARIALPELCKCCKCTDYNDLAQCGMRCSRG